MTIFDQVAPNNVKLSSILFFTDVASAHPIFTPALVLGLRCQANSAIELAGHAINQLSGVDYNDITSVLNGTLAPVSGTPLDCITNEIIYMQQRILTIFDDVVPVLENSIQTECKWLENIRE